MLEFDGSNFNPIITIFHSEYESPAYTRVQNFQLVQLLVIEKGTIINKLNKKKSSKVDG